MSDPASPADPVVSRVAAAVREEAARADLLRRARERLGPEVSALWVDGLWYVGRVDFVPGTGTLVPRLAAGCAEDETSALRGALRAEGAAFPPPEPSGARWAPRAGEAPAGPAADLPPPGVEATRGGAPSPAGGLRAEDLRRLADRAVIPVPGSARVLPAAERDSVALRAGETAAAAAVCAALGASVRFLPGGGARVSLETPPGAVWAESPDGLLPAVEHLCGALADVLGRGVPAGDLPAGRLHLLSANDSPLRVLLEGDDADAAAEAEAAELLRRQPGITVTWRGRDLRSGTGRAVHLHLDAVRSGPPSGAR